MTESRQHPPLIAPVGTDAGARAPDHAPDARRQLFVADLLSVAAGTLLAIALHRPLGVAPVLAPNGIQAHALMFLMFNIVVLLRLGLAGQYELGIRFSRIDDLLVVVRATFIAAAVSVFVAVATKGFLLDFEQYSRAYAALGFLVPAAMLMASRLVGHAMQVAAFADGRYLAHSLVIGGGSRAERFLDWLREHPHLGFLGQQSAVDVNLDLREYMRGFAAEIEAFEPDEVILALESPKPGLRAAIVREASFIGISVKVLPEVFENYYDMPFSRYEGIPVTTIFESPGHRFARSLKHGVDRLGALVGLLVLMPLFALIALAIWLEDRGTVVFAQERVGERGKRFRVRKFRTMRVDAEQVRAQLDDSNEAQGPIFKMRDDPRVTRVGRFLRRTSFDEFPQLWNVVFGEMSLVGPRPPLPTEVDEYSPRHRRRLLARPGMTGLWQVSGRSNTTFDEMVDFDLVYIENWSFWLDAKILLRTLWVVAARKGAY